MKRTYKNMKLNLPHFQAKSTHLTHPPTYEKTLNTIQVCQPMLVAISVSDLRPVLSFKWIIRAKDCQLSIKLTK